MNKVTDGNMIGKINQDVPAIPLQYEDGSEKVIWVLKIMIEFDYDLDYKNTLFKPNRSRYGIGRGEQGITPINLHIQMYMNTGDLKHLKLHKKIRCKNI